MSSFDLERFGIPKEDRMQPAIGYMLDQSDIVPEPYEAGSQQIIYTEASRLYEDRTGYTPSYGLGLRAKQQTLLTALANNFLNAVIVGTDKLAEFNARRLAEGFKTQAVIFADVPMRERPTARFSLAACRESNLRRAAEVGDLEGQTIATSYPMALRRVLAEQNVTPGEIIAVDSTVESFARVGRIPYIADVVETGRSLQAEEFVEGQTLFDVKPVFVTMGQIDQADQAKKIEAMCARFDRLINLRSRASSLERCVPA